MVDDLSFLFEYEEKKEENPYTNDFFPDYNDFLRNQDKIPQMPACLNECIIDESFIQKGYNHVQVNHLYGLSIKDSVLVLCQTNHYRKSYITTIFYKPIN